MLPRKGKSKEIESLISPQSVMLRWVDVRVGIVRGVAVGTFEEAECRSKDTDVVGEAGDVDAATSKVVQHISISLSPFLLPSGGICSRPYPASPIFGVVEFIGAAEVRTVSIAVTSWKATSRCMAA